MSTKLRPSYGSRFADTFMVGDINAVWGARLIWPDDLVHDRQDLDSNNDEAKAALIAWLNGASDGSGGAIAKMHEKLKTPVTLGLKYDGNQTAVIYEDEDGIIMGSAQSSHGYVYVSAWLKP
jgi:hypothetical protein